MMDHEVSSVLDVELSPRDIVALGGADAISAFFAQLGITLPRAHHSPRET